MAAIDPTGTPPPAGAADEAMRRSLAERFSQTPPTAPIAGCGLETKKLELGCFFDGTGNNRWVLDETSSVTNVVQLHDAYVTGPRADGSAERDKHYLIGVGAGVAPGRPEQPQVGTNGASAGSGFGGKFRCNLMYEWVKAKIEAHARVYSNDSPKLIDVFGFSRGALSARTFVNLINQALKTEPGPAFRNIEVRFLGAFDTVESLHIGAGSEAPNCHVTNSDYRAARHFTARHEIRVFFPLTLLDPGAQSVEYPGVHSDVGGGYADGFQNRPNWLSLIPLVDMRAACRAQGIEMGAVPIPLGCDVSATSVLRTGSDEELRRSFIHVSHGGWPHHPEPRGGRRRRLSTTRMRLSARPPEYFWSE